MGKYFRIFFVFPHILGSPSSYMTLQLLHSEFPYIRGKFDFLFYQCTTFRNGRDSRTLVSSYLYNSADFTHTVRFYLCAWRFGNVIHNQSTIFKMPWIGRYDCYDRLWKSTVISHNWTLWIS
jgi:hypothetical protein